MRKPIILVVGVLLSAATAALAQAPKQFTPAQRGEAVVKLLAAQRFHQVESQFDARMAKGLPEAKLSEVWAQIQSQAGPFKQITSSSVTKSQGNDVAMVHSAFQAAPLIIVVAFDSDGKIGGLWFRPAQ